MAGKATFAFAACLMLSLEAAAAETQPGEGAAAPSRLVVSDAFNVRPTECKPEPAGLSATQNRSGVGSERDRTLDEALAREGRRETKGGKIGGPQGNIELVEERYPNRTVKIAREMTQDARGNYLNHGSWKMWDEGGVLVAEGQYRQGERHGVWNRWYRSGEARLFSEVPYQQFTAPFISQATFEYGKLNGTWTIYDSKQRKISEYEFADGKRHGRSLLWYADGRKMREAAYRNGELDGELIEWAPDARVVIKETYQQGRKLAPKVEYYAGGQKKSEGTYFYPRTTVQSPDDWWNAKVAVYTGQGKEEKNGPWISWYATGQKQLEGAYLSNVQVGRFTWWYPNGQKALEGSYDNGKQYGTWVWWHQNGQKATEGKYADGNPTGRWVWWNDDGKVAKSTQISEGVQKVMLPASSGPAAGTVIEKMPAQPRGR